MSFPNPTVLTAFLREYLKYRETTTWNTTTGYLKSQVRDDATAKKGLCEETNRKFYNQRKLSTVDGWIDLIYSLGEEGRKPGYMYSDTLQTIRSYIVAVLLELPEKPANPEDPNYRAHKANKEEFLRRRQLLAEETERLDKDIEQAILAKEAKQDVDRQSRTYHSNLLKLADLGDPNATLKAARLGLFKKLAYPDLSNRSQPLISELNENIPLCYHDRYYLFFYTSFIQPRLKVSFADFVTLSIQNDKKDIEEVDKPKADTTSVFGSFASGVASFVQRMRPAPVTQDPPGPDAQEPPASTQVARHPANRQAAVSPLSENGERPPSSPRSGSEESRQPASSQGTSTIKIVKRLPLADSANRSDDLSGSEVSAPIPSSSPPVLKREQRDQRPVPLMSSSEDRPPLSVSGENLSEPSAPVELSSSRTVDDLDQSAEGTLSSSLTKSQ